MKHSGHEVAQLVIWYRLGLLSYNVDLLWIFEYVVRGFGLLGGEILFPLRGYCILLLQYYYCTYCDCEFNLD